MDKLSCIVKLTFGNNAKKPEEILAMVLNGEFSIYEIEYKAGVEYAQHYKEDKFVKLSIEAENSVNEEIKGGGIYFILSAEKDTILYIGKSTDLKKRLKEHLLECNSSTSSHLQDVLEYLNKRNAKKQSLKLAYCVINTSDNKNNAAIEGALIDCVSSNKAKYGQCWNTRRD